MKYAFLLTFFVFFHQVFATDLQALSYEFGVITIDQYGEPTGFKQTTTITIEPEVKHIIYGLIISSPDEEVFTLDSIHTVPNRQNSTTQIMSKQIRAKKKTAIFMKAYQSDLAGDYKIDVFINGVFAKTIYYQIIKGI